MDAAQLKPVNDGDDDISGRRDESYLLQSDTGFQLDDGAHHHHHHCHAFFWYKRGLLLMMMLMMTRLC